MPGPDLPPLRYLPAAVVEAAMPPLATRLALAEQTLRALVPPAPGLAPAAELPAKIGVHPRPADAFAHAMPAYLRGAAPDGRGDRLGIKWVAGVPANPAAGLPAIHALLVLNDPLTGAPLAVADAGPITAQRTAAVSGIAIRLLGPGIIADRAPRATLIGAGIQGRSHVPVLGALLPGLHLTILDREPERASALATTAAATAGIGRVRTATDLHRAVSGSDVVVTCASFGPDHGLLAADALAPDALVVAVDYDIHASAGLARDAALFLTDEIAGFAATRAGGTFFQGFPDPAGTLGEALADPARWPRPAGRVLVAHLGVGLADVVLGAAVFETAAERGLGIELPR